MYSSLYLAPICRTRGENSRGRTQSRGRATDSSLVQSVDRQAIGVSTKQLNCLALYLREQPVGQCARSLCSIHGHTNGLPLGVSACLWYVPVRLSRQGAARLWEWCLDRSVKDGPNRHSNIQHLFSPERRLLPRRSGCLA
jgi:hypothetical protein